MDYYVLLTGGKNNAGDFLIKYRAKKLLKELRPDRDFKDFNAWEPFDAEKLEIVNKSKALLLTGGPAVSKYMFDVVYKLTNDLDLIKVPIIFFGLGWYDPSGELHDVHRYNFSMKTKQLLNKVFSSGFSSSVRDYHTMHDIKKEGFDDILMTGCPALYDINFFNRTIIFEPPKRIIFSLGVNHAKSKAMENSMKKIILSIYERYPVDEFVVMFHHSVDPSYLKTANASKKLFKSNYNFYNWLNDKGINTKDISGSAGELMEEYSNCDLHVGYRVHAHIYMSSISKPSILIAEDGRGKALEQVIGGEIISGFISLKNSIFSKLLSKVSSNLYDPYTVDEKLDELIVTSIDYELKNHYQRLKAIRANINNNFEVMKKFMDQLP